MKALAITGMLACSVFTHAAVAQPPVAPADHAGRGLSGTVEVLVKGAHGIRVRADQSPQAPIVVRLAGKQENSGGTSYTLEYIGTVAGRHDLRQALESDDGMPLDIPPVWVEISSTLPPDHGTDLFLSSQMPELRGSWYRPTLIAAGVIWAACPVIYLGLKLARRTRPASVPPPPSPPTLAEQLRPLVESAAAGTLSMPERANLELMLYQYWRGRLGLSERQAEAVSRLREHPEAGTLLRAIERWLHAARSNDDGAQREVAGLLEPFRHAPAVAIPAGGRS